MASKFTQIRFVALLYLLFSLSTVSAQTTVFSEDFTNSQGTTYTISNGLIGSSTIWRASRSGNDFGAMINTGRLTLTNDGSTAYNNAGWILGYTNSSDFPAPYSTTLASNPGVITWTFSMRISSSNPSGFGTTGYGNAFILAGTAGTTNLTGTGYAVVLGSPWTTIDPIRLVRYDSGIRNHTNLITSNTSGLTDFGSQYVSVRVTYTPVTNTWQLFLRNDASSTTANPATGTLVSQGTAVNSTYTGSPLTIMGTYYNGNTGSKRTAFFDSIRLSVAVPTLVSLSPFSRIANSGAFTLTVNGSNFASNSIVRWNGSNRTTTYVSPTQLTASIPASDLTTSGTADVTVINGTTVSNALPFTIDPAGVPVLTLSTATLNVPATVTGTASGTATYTISGANLTADPTVTAPSNFEISRDNTTFSSSLVLPRTGNNLTGQPVTLYARLRAATPAGIYSGTISHAVSGGTTKFTDVSGTVLASQPTTQPTTLTFTNVTSTTFTANWNNGNGASRLLLIRSGSAVNSSPVDSNTYVASPIFGNGSEIGTGNFVAYAGSSNSVTITGLTPATAYYVSVFEYNGSGETENYLTTSPLTGNRTTLNAPLGWQIASVNTPHTIDFDNTVDGVNNDTFQGEGLASAPVFGQLNSNAWAVSGFSDGNLSFGANTDEGGDFDQGVSDGEAPDGGIYAFETSPDNFSLGIHPAPDDFAPGSLTLRFQNQSGATMNSISIGYKVYVYNDKAASSNFNFSHSANNSTYTAVSGLDVVSPAAADGSPIWKSYYRVVTITGLSIPSNSYYYLRWSSATVSGSVEFDEFALDDIVLVANPTTNFASFAGNAESFVVQGNTSLSGDVSVAGPTIFNAGRVDIAGRTLTLNGTVTNTVTGGIRGSATSNLVLGGSVNKSLSFDQTTPGTTNLFNSFSVSDSGVATITATNPFAVSGTLFTDTDKILDLGTTTVSGTLATINNNGTIRTQNTSALPLPTGKNWAGSGTVHFNAASAAQTIVPGTYNNLTVSSTAGATASGAFTVNGNLYLPQPNPNATTGSLSTGSFAVTMGPNAYNSGVGEVTGTTTRNSIASNVTYTFGHQDISILFPNVGTLPTSMSLRTQIGTAPTWLTGAVRRVYDFIQTGGSGTKAVIKSRYLDSELNGNNESRLVDYAYIVNSSTLLEQGRSNYNTTENWIELSNVNVGLYFSSSFDAVKLTFDESSAASLTWNGSVSDSWTTAANWTPNATPSDNTIVYIPNAATTPNDPLLNPNALLGSLIIETGGILNSPNNAQLTMNNGAGAWINNGTFNPGTGTSRVTFKNLDATIAGSTNFNNLTIDTGAGLRPLTDNVMRISGEFLRIGNFGAGATENTVEFNGTGQTIPVPTGTLSAYHDLVINGTGAVFPTSLNISGNLIINQPVNFSGKTITMNASQTHAIGGSANPAFNNLVLDLSDGEINLNTNISVTGTLTLTRGNLNIGGYNLTLGSNPVAGSFSNTRMIVADGSGQVRRNFTATGTYFYPIGEKVSNAAYSPISVTIDAGTFSGAYVGVNVRDGVHPNNYSTQNSISRYWQVTQSGITGAVASIAAIYLPAEVLAPESTMVAAQLIGTFNQQTNPWIRFQPLSGFTLTATGASLPAGQTSVFTGIKGGTFTTEISGHGSFCPGTPITLSTVQTGGDGPFTYFWSNGLGTSATVTPPNNVVGTTNYTVTVKDANGISATDTKAVTILAEAVGGTTSANQTVCSGTVASDITLSGSSGNIVYWQRAFNADFSDAIGISNTTSILTSAQIGTVSQTTYFRAVLQNVPCPEVYFTSVQIEVRSTTWNGTAWSNGAPDSTTSAIIEGDYTQSQHINACSLTVNSGNVSIPSGFDVSIGGALTVNGGSFNMANDVNLIQFSDAANSGNISIKRKTSPLFRLDYVMWSAPVTGAQTLKQFSPQTVDNRFYGLNTTDNLFTVLDPNATTFQKGKGYLIRMPNNHVSYSETATPAIWEGTFTGTPNNGSSSLSLDTTGQRFNMIGNPYPSMMDADAFLEANVGNIDGTIYFWRRRNNAPTQGELTSAYYATYTIAGGAGVDPVATASDSSEIPNGFIQTGQGFMVRATAVTPASGAVVYNNTMRTAANNDDQFFRLDPENGKSRIWLNATNAEGAFSQTLIAYMPNAVNEVDRADGKYMLDGTFSFSSYLDE